MKVKPRYWVALVAALALAAAAKAEAKSQIQLEADATMRTIMEKEPMVAHVMCYSALHVYAEEAELFDRAELFVHEKRHGWKIDNIRLGPEAKYATHAEAKRAMISETRADLASRAHDSLDWEALEAMAKACKEI